jgi:signal peptidase I
LDAYTLKLYASILSLEDYPLPADRETFLRKPPGKRTYIFKYDYYFFLGDNFYESEDSRRWGFVPRFSLLGKMILKI